MLENLYTGIEIVHYSSLLILKRTAVTEEKIHVFLQHYASKGDLIYFYKLNRNENLIVLNQQRLHDELCRVITYKDIPEITDGIITHTHLNQVFYRKYIQQILHQFRDASTFIPFNEDSELIPHQLLIRKPPDHAWPLAHKENQVNFVFQFSFLPSELFPRIIAAIDRNYSKFCIAE